MQTTTVIITGMPRSGTSFTASLLQSAGLDIGQRLMAPGHGNEKGFFEDLQIVDFHESVLLSQGIHPVGWTLRDDIRVEETHWAQAREYIRRNAVSRQWGWKDPRTTLFLDFWAELLPDACFLFAYRAPWEVADSLFRRGDESFAREPELAIQVWIHYNRLLLRFYDRFPQRCLITSVYSAARQTEHLIRAINTRFGTDLVLPPRDLFEQSLLHTGASEGYYPALVAQAFPQALALYRELNAREAQTGLAPVPFDTDRLEGNAVAAGAFRNWLLLRRHENTIKRLEAELEQLRAQLEQGHSEVALPGHTSKEQ
jgi:hypothetical protein